VERAPEELTEPRTSSRRFSTTASIMASTTSGSTALKPSPRSPLALRPHSSQAPMLVMHLRTADGNLRGSTSALHDAPLTSKASETAAHVLGVFRMSDAATTAHTHTPTWAHPQPQRNKHTRAHDAALHSPQRRHPPCALGPRGKGQGRCLRPGVPSPGPTLTTLCCLLQLLQQQLVHLGANMWGSGRVASRRWHHGTGWLETPIATPPPPGRARTTIGHERSQRVPPPQNCRFVVTT
jgi:hypothetical protein